MSNSNNLEKFYVNTPEQLPSQGEGVDLNFIVDVLEGSLIDFNNVTIQNETSTSGIYYVNIIFGHTNTELPTERHQFPMPIPAQNLYSQSGNPIIYYVISYNDGTGNNRKESIICKTGNTP